MIEFLPLDTKEEDKLSKEDECDYLRQRCHSLNIVLDTFQEQLAKYKTKCEGVDTISKLLKESKLENVKLKQLVKTLELAISVLQKRLTKNGLSNSVNVHDTELFVPGSSKQTLDNLAKENARLRNLLKQESQQPGKKFEKEFEDMKLALEKAESENIELKDKLKNLKLIEVSGYREAIQKLNQDLQDEKIKHEQEKNRNSQSECETKSVESQMNISGANDVEELKVLLKQTMTKCGQLEGKLPISFASDQATSFPMDKNEKTRVSGIPVEEHKQLKRSFDEAVLMNQRWQVHSKEREKQIQALNDRIQEISNPIHLTVMVDEAVKQKTASLTVDLNKRDQEILEYRKQIQDYDKKVTNIQSQCVQLRQENSTVEILKQQIQVCTEDFNTERKDREAVVQKSRQLQDEINQLKRERTDLQQQVSQFKRLSETQNRQQQSRALPTYEACLSANYNNELPPDGQQLSNPSTPQLRSSSPIQLNSPSTQGGNNMPSRYPYHVVPVQESVESLGPAPHYQGIPFSDYHGASNYSFNEPAAFRPNAHPDMRNYGGLHQSFPNNLSRSNTPPMHVSSHSLVRRGTSTKDEISCPNCSKKFSDDDLVSHVNQCNSRL